MSRTWPCCRLGSGWDFDCALGSNHPVGGRPINDLDVTGNRWDFESGWRGVAPKREVAEMRSETAGMGRRALGVGCAAMAVASALAACGGITYTRGEPVLDTEKVESEIQNKVTDTVPGSRASVVCPGDVDIARGATFDCEATVNGQQAYVEVTQTSDQGDVTYAFESAFVSLDKVQTDISTGVSAKVPGTWTTECSPPGASGGIYVAAVGSTFTCQVSGTSAAGEQQSGQVEATVADIGGGVNWRLVQ